MRTFRALLGRELSAYFLSPLTYLVLTLFYLVQGFLFFLYVETSRGNLDTITRATYSSNFFFILVSLAPPLLSMRLVAQEKRTGTIEVLLTAPVSDLQVILAKYLASWVLYVVLWLPSLLHIVVLVRYGASPHWGPVLLGFGGTLCLGGLYLSIGLFASTVSDEQMVAAVLSTVFCLLLLFLHFLHFLGPPPEYLPYLRHLSIPLHFHDLSKGVLDTRAPVLFLSGTLFFLFCTLRVFESRHWRSP